MGWLDKKPDEKKDGKPLDLCPKMVTCKGKWGRGSPGRSGSCRCCKEKGHGGSCNCYCGPMGF